MPHPRAGRGRLISASSSAVCCFAPVQRRDAAELDIVTVFTSRSFSPLRFSVTDVFFLMKWRRVRLTRVCVGVCFRALQPSGVGDDVCDVPVSGSCHRVHLRVLQPCGIQPQPADRQE